MIKRALKMLFPGSPYAPDAWGNPNDVQYARSPGAFVGLLLLLVVFAVVIVVVAPA